MASCGLKSLTDETDMPEISRFLGIVIRDMEITNVPIMTLAGMFITHEPHVFCRVGKQLHRLPTRCEI